MSRVKVDHTWGIMCPRCYKVESAADTGMQDVFTTVDLIWWLGWFSNDHYGWICDTCADDV